MTSAKKMETNSETRANLKLSADLTDPAIFQKRELLDVLSLVKLPCFELPAREVAHRLIFGFTGSSKW